VRIDVVPVNGVLLESGIDLGPLLPHHLSEVVVGIILMLLVPVLNRLLKGID